MLAHAVRQRPTSSPLRLRQPARHRLSQQDRGQHRLGRKILEEKAGMFHQISEIRIYLIIVGFRNDRLLI